MDSSISIPLDLSGLVPPSLSSQAPPLPLVQVRPASLEAPPVARAKMQPHIGYALLLTLGLLAVLMAVNAAWTIAAIAITLAQGGEINVTTMTQFGADHASVVLLTLFSSSCIYCVSTAAIAFRGQMIERLSIRKITRTQLAAIVALAMPLAVVFSSLAVAIVTLLGWNTAGPDIISEPPTLALALFSIAVLPAIGEEIFFRGFLSRGLIARHGVILGVLLASALFAVVHVNPVQVFVVFFLGVVAQAVFMWTRSILASILLHGLYNATIVVFARNAPAEFSLVDEATILPSIVVSLLAVAALLVVLFQSRTQWKLPDGSQWSPGYVATDMPPRTLNAVAVSAKTSRLPVILAALSMAALIAMTTLSIMY